MIFFATSVAAVLMSDTVNVLLDKDSGNIASPIGQSLTEKQTTATQKDEGCGVKAEAYEFRAFVGFLRGSASASTWGDLIPPIRTATTLANASAGANQGHAGPTLIIAEYGSSDSSPVLNSVETPSIVRKMSFFTTIETIYDRTVMSIDATLPSNSGLTKENRLNMEKCQFLTRRCQWKTFDGRVVIDLILPVKNRNRPPDESMKAFFRDQKFIDNHSPNVIVSGQGRHEPRNASFLFDLFHTKNTLWIHSKLGDDDSGVFKIRDFGVRMPMYMRKSLSVGTLAEAENLSKDYEEEDGKMRTWITEQRKNGVKYIVTVGTRVTKFNKSIGGLLQTGLWNALLQKEEVAVISKCQVESIEEKYRDRFYHYDYFPYWRLFSLGDFVVITTGEGSTWEAMRSGKIAIGISGILGDDKRANNKCLKASLREGKFVRGGNCDEDNGAFKDLDTLEKTYDKKKKAEIIVRLMENEDLKSNAVQVGETVRREISRTRLRIIFFIRMVKYLWGQQLLHGNKERLSKEKEIQKKMDKAIEDIRKVEEDCDANNGKVDFTLIETRDSEEQKMINDVLKACCAIAVNPALEPSSQ